MKLHDSRIEGTKCANLHLLNHRTRIGQTLLRLAMVLACYAAAPGAQAESEPSNFNRFLFIIDTSASMRPFDKTLRETAFDLVYSGLRGGMTNGDTYGIWLVDEQNDTSFPMESWKQRYAVQLGAKAAAYVKDHGYKGRARLDVAVAEALNVVKHVGDLTIVLVSNGETPIAGTAFDEAVNTRFRELALEMKRTKATLNTVFVARDGELAAWGINNSEFLLNVPSVPRKPKAAAPMLASKTNPPAARVATVVSNSAFLVAAAVPANTTPKTRPAAPPIIITKDTVAQERRAFQAMAMIGTTNDPAAPSMTNLQTASTGAAETNIPLAKASASEPGTATSATNAFWGPSNKASLAVAANRISTTDAVTSVEMKAPKATSSELAEPVLTVISPPSEPVRSRSWFQPVLWAGAGAGAMLVCMLALMTLSRGRRIQPSLISQAAAQERVRVG